MNKWFYYLIAGLAVGLISFKIGLVYSGYKLEIDMAASNRILIDVLERASELPAKQKAAFFEDLRIHNEIVFKEDGRSDFYNKWEPVIRSFREGGVYNRN